MHRIGRNFITSVHLNIIKRTAVSRAIVNSLREKIDPSDFQLMYPKQNQPALSAFRSRIGLSSIDMNQIILCIDHSAPDFDVRHSNGMMHQRYLII